MSTTDTEAGNGRSVDPVLMQIIGGELDSVAPSCTGAVRMLPRR